MARSILDIIIKLSKQGGADRETVKGLVQVKSSLTQVMGVAAAVTGVLYTAKKAFDFAKEGAQLQFVEDRFNRLGATIGANTNLLGDLREVTRGLYSDTELMASATDLMGLGLANNTEELERLMRVSSGLNMNMNQLVLTLTNMTTMRFDALGVSVDGFKGKVDALKDAGMDADKAFKEAFLQQAEAQLEKVGEAADSTAGDVMKLEANFANLIDTMKKDSADAAGPLINQANEAIRGWSEFYKFMRSQGEIRDIQIELRNADALKGQAQDLTSYAEAAREVWAVRQQFSGEDPGLNFANAAADARAYELTLKEITTATESYAYSLDTVQASISGPIVNAQQDYRERLVELGDQLTELRAEEAKWFAPPEGSKKYDELQEKISDVQREIDNTTAAYEEQARQIMFNIAQEQILASSLQADAQAEAIAVLGQSMGMWDQQTADAISTTAQWTSQLAEGAITSEEYAGYVNLLGDSIFGLDKQAEEAANGGVATANDALHEGVVQAFGYKEQVESLIGQLDQLDGMSAHANITISVNGSVPNMANLSGGGTINYGQMGKSGGGLGDWSQYLDSGGTLSADTAIIGERGYEIAAKDESGRYQIIPHEISKALVDMGLVGDARKLVEGGPLSGQFIHPVTGSILNTTGASPHRRRRSRTSSTSVTSDQGGETTTVSESNVIETVAMPLVSVTEKAVQSVAAAQVQSSVEARQTRAQAAAQSREMTGILRSIDKRLQRQERTLATAIQSAIQQRPA